MKKKKLFYVAVCILGICCITASFFFKGEDVKTVSGMLIGIGAGLVGMSLSNLIMKHLEQKNPEIKKQNEIEYNDERNTLIRNHAKAKAGAITQWLIMGIAYITIMIAAPIWVTLVVVAVFLTYNVICIYLMNKYQKEM